MQNNQLRPTRWRRLTLGWPQMSVLYSDCPRWLEATVLHGNFATLLESYQRKKPKTVDWSAMFIQTRTGELECCDKIGVMTTFWSILFVFIQYGEGISRLSWSDRNEESCSCARHQDEHGLLERPYSPRRSRPHCKLNSLWIEGTTYWCCASSSLLIFGLSLSVKKLQFTFTFHSVRITWQCYKVKTF
jgi:hypothetical protein